MVQNDITIQVLIAYTYIQTSVINLLSSLVINLVYYVIFLEFILGNKHSMISRIRDMQSRIVE